MASPSFFRGFFTLTEVLAPFQGVISTLEDEKTVLDRVGADRQQAPGIYDSDEQSGGKYIDRQQRFTKNENGIRYKERRTVDFFRRPRMRRSVLIHPIRAASLRYHLPFVGFLSE